MRGRNSDLPDKTASRSKNLSTEILSLFLDNLANLRRSAFLNYRSHEVCAGVKVRVTVSKRGCQ